MHLACCQSQTLKASKNADPGKALKAGTYGSSAVVLVLSLVEVEFDSVDAANEFTAPDWFGEDVTESGKYHNSYLSRLENS